MLDYCKGKFFDLKINTNATRLTEKLILYITTHNLLKNNTGFMFIG